MLITTLLLLTYCAVNYISHFLFTSVLLEGILYLYPVVLSNSTNIFSQTFTGFKGLWVLKGTLLLSTATVVPCE
jgi:hypothetical protein